MKTDRVLTIDECLNEWGMVPTRVEPAGCDARHIPIAEEKDLDSRATHAAAIAIAGVIRVQIVRAQNPTAVEAPSFVSQAAKNQMEYLATMTMYVWIIARCLRQA